MSLLGDGYRTEAKVSVNGGTSGGVPFSRGMLYRLLANPVYRGITVHKGQAHPGEHEAIVSQKLWDKVQLVLAERTQGHSQRMKAKEPSLCLGVSLATDLRPHSLEMARKWAVCPTSAPYFSDCNQRLRTTWCIIVRLELVRAIK